MIGEIGNFKMKKLLLILLCLPFIGFGQDENHKIKNIKVDFNNELLEINYDISSFSSSYFNISLYVYEGKKLIVRKEKRTQNIYGDIGKGIMAGKYKKISWKVLDDNIELVGDNLIFEVSADIIKQRSATNFLLPGRYNYIVSQKKKHLSKSLLFYSALAAGIYYGSVSSTNQQKYNDATKLNEINDYYNKANTSLQLSYLCYGISGTIMIDNIYRLFKKNKVR
tara:strand:- start:2655 stop:3326 length:672 start_codon:yes stop_codon:yes gene_type:complete